MAETEQEIMQSPPKNIKANGDQYMASIDSINEVNYKEAKIIFDRYGFPGFDLVGEEGSKSFWLIVQHSNKWPDFQVQVLKEMETQVKKKNAHSTYFAYLVDRVKIRAGEKQVYGTQVSYRTDSCQAYVDNVEDPENINHRRVSMGLETIEQYLNTVSTNHFLRNEEAFRKKGITGPTLYPIIQAEHSMGDTLKNISNNDTIQLSINEQNTIYFKAIFNRKDTLTLNCDTGSSDITLKNSVLDNKLSSKPELYNVPYELKIGNNTYKAPVYDTELSGHGTDGRFGWDLFKDRVVEINYDKGILVVHSETPKAILNDTSFTTLKIEYFDNCFSVNSSFIQDDSEHENSFLFDTGYQRTVMVDLDLLNESNFPVNSMQIIKKVIMKTGTGEEIPVITSILDGLKMGDHVLENIPVQQTTLRKPFKGINIHVLGNEVLKRFNTFLDFKNDRVYLKPNNLFMDKYIENKTAVSFTLPITPQPAS